MNTILNTADSTSFVFAKNPDVPALEGYQFYYMFYRNMCQ